MGRSGLATGKLRIDKQIYPVGGKLILNEPKTKAANRTIILPPAMVELLAEYKKGVFSELMFPSRTKPEQPIDPNYVRKRLQVVLERAGRKRVRFHDLRHTFATLSLENGMGVKTLSTIIGHVSSATTLNTYTRIADDNEAESGAEHRPGYRQGGSGACTGTDRRTPKAGLRSGRTAPLEAGTGCVSQLREHPGVTRKSLIARKLKMVCSTV